MSARLPKLFPAIASVLTVLGLVLGLVLFSSAVADPVPQPEPGNQKCDRDLGLASFGSISAPGESLGAISTTLNPDGTFDWSISSGAVSVVLVKGGPVTNVYDFSPGALSGSGLTTATNPKNGKTYSYSKIEFCVGTIPPTPTNTPLPPTPTNTPLPPTPTSTPSGPTPTATATVTPFPTDTPTPTNTPTVTPFPTSTPTATVTPFPTSTPTATVTPFPTDTPTPTPANTPTNTPVPPTPTNTPTLGPTPTP